MIEQDISYLHKQCHSRSLVHLLFGSMNRFDLENVAILWCWWKKCCFWCWCWVLTVLTLILTLSAEGTSFWERTNWYKTPIRFNLIFFFLWDLTFSSVFYLFFFFIGDLLLRAHKLMKRSPSIRSTFHPFFPVFSFVWDLLMRALKLIKRRLSITSPFSSFFNLVCLYFVFFCLFPFWHDPKNGANHPKRRQKWSRMFFLSSDRGWGEFKWGIDLRAVGLSGGRRCNRGRWWRKRVEWRKYWKWGQ